MVARSTDDAMDSLIFSGFVRLDGIPRARFFVRTTLEPVALSRPDCVARLNNLRAAGANFEETAKGVKTWPPADA
jgi:hypothetical protein